MPSNGEKLNIFVFPGGTAIGQEINKALADNSEFIKNKKSIFIDDSFKERKEVMDRCCVSAS